MTLSLQRLGFGEAHQLLAFGLRGSKQEFAICLAARLLADGIGLALGLNLLALRHDFGLPAFLFRLFDLRLGDRRRADGAAVLFGITNIVNLEADDWCHGGWGSAAPGALRALAEGRHGLGQLENQPGIVGGRRAGRLTLVDDPGIGPMGMRGDPPQPAL